MNKIKIYWLCHHPQAAHREKALLLEKYGYEVIFFLNIDTLLQALSTQRVQIIIIGDEGEQKHIEKNIIQLSKNPEVQGARLILSLSQPSLNLENLAACSAFRDIIPLNIIDTHWINRFIFATSKSQINIASPASQVTINSICSIAIPARITLISTNKIFLEAKLNPEKEQIINISGNFVKSIGLSSLSLTVNTIKRRDLVFRFSTGIETRWNIPERKKDVVYKIIEQMQHTNFGPRCKVFIAVQTPEIRSAIIKELDPLRFDLNVALKKQSIIDEPKYFSPKIVFIEDKLCINQKEDFERFVKMLQILEPEVPVCIIGTSISLQKLEAIDTSRKFFILSKLPEKLSQVIFTKYLIKQNALDQYTDAVYIPPDHPFSIAEINVPARLHLVHPIEVQVALNTKIDKFGLCRIDSPWFKKNLGWYPYAKIKNSYENSLSIEDNFKNIINCYLADLSKDNQIKIAKAIINYTTSTFNSTFGLTSIEQQFDTKQEKQIELTPPIIQPVKQDYLHQKQTTVTKSTEESDEYQEIDLQKVIYDAHKSFQRSVNNFISILFSSGFKAFVFFLFISTLLFGIIYVLSIIIAPSWHKSGKQYSESLKKFAPHKFGEYIQTDKEENSD